MPTIQIRNVPPEAYDALRRRAKAEGKSLQSYMHEQVTRLAQMISKKEMLTEYRAKLLQNPPRNVTLESIVADIHEGRRERFGD
ncbi:MAG TPA: hypothetical protein VFV67_24900 [Actinophytocola sp.]|uniref:FitA-like ribbon-helix-helix domain-containing protein n=1 Tax=Actinophytocola sp. TaxID=1872138 RepID=UPI002DB6D073|nr:hypothetical protein [Actinophytocola sp.]HEU5473898.1 hypothetical protein [Actinophytocola sp.]